MTGEPRTPPELPPLDAAWWAGRYAAGQTGWDLGAVSPPLRAFFDALEDRGTRILIPGAGRAWEAEYLHRSGFTRVHVLDWAPQALAALRERVPDFPEAHLLQGDFFAHEGRYDLIVEQTFFCAIAPARRAEYVARAEALLAPGGRVAGLLFDDPLNADHPPFGGDAATYRALFGARLRVERLEPCAASVRPRAGRELFLVARKPSPAQAGRPYLGGMRILDAIPLESLIFFDIETASQEAEFAELPEPLREAWAHHRDAAQRPEDVDEAAWWKERAGLHAEFGRVVCIALGFFVRGKDGRQFRVKSMADPDEAVLLAEFSTMLEKYFPDLRQHRLCGHNIKGFDIPWLCRRLVIHGMALPTQLDVAGLKPWEVPHLDTMELWRFGDHRAYPSLRLMAAALGIPSPKDDIDGSQVGRVFWEEQDLDRIAAYCAKDVVTTARLVLRLKERGRGVLDDADVIQA